MLILGHRGGVGGTVAQKGAQNSLRAFAAALDICDGFETDACLSGDGEIFLIHEANDAAGIAAHLDAASAAKVAGRRLRQLSAAEIGGLRLRDGQAMPRLREALELVGRQAGKTINIELKGFGAAGPVLALLREFFTAGLLAPGAVIVSSFHHAALQSVRAAMPGLKIGALVVAAVEDGEALYPFEDAPEARAACYAGLEQALSSPLLRAVMPDYFVMPEKMLSAEAVKKVAAVFPAARLCGWTVTESRDYDQRDLLRRLRELPPEKIGAVIADDPAAFAREWRG